MNNELPDPGLTPLGVVILLTMCLLTWLLRRKHALLPLLFTTCYIPLGQSIVIAGANFQFFRILLFIGWCRVIIKQESRDFKFTRMDNLFIAWLLVTLVLGSLSMHSEFSQKVVSQCGIVYTAAGSYFLVRWWIRDLDELFGVIGAIALMILPMALSMIVEKSTGRNIFYVFGGVPEFTSIREGKLRCQGAFRHPILAGAYGATLFPLFAGLWFQKANKRITALVGGISAVVITIAAASSGALITFLGALLGLVLWPFRSRMRFLRRITVLTIIVLALFMSSPVWYLIARLSEIFGGTGWYRSYIIDMAIQHFDEWWLVGSAYTAHWAPAGQVLAANPNSTDVINNYVAEGLDGGLLKLGLFVAMIVTGFKIIGRCVTEMYPLPEGRAISIWTFGISLACHCLMFFSVAYFDQIVVMWYWVLACLAMISSLPNYLMSVPSVGARANESSIERGQH